MVDHVSNHTDLETGDTTMNYFYTCFKPGCKNYRKIINGAEEGKEATILTPELAKAQPPPEEAPTVEPITETVETQQQTQP
jgi:hypothetical protein